MRTIRKYGRELAVGDVVEVWWQPHRDVITALRPYVGRLAHLFPDGARLAEFAILRSGMTIDNGDVFGVLARP